MLLCGPLWVFCGSFVVLCGPLWSFVGLLWVLCGPCASFAVLCGPLRYLVIPDVEDVLAQAVCLYASTDNNYIVQKCQYIPNTITGCHHSGKSHI